MHLSHLAFYVQQCANADLSVLSFGAVAHIVLCLTLEKRGRSELYSQNLSHRSVSLLHYLCLSCSFVSNCRISSRFAITFARGLPQEFHLAPDDPLVLARYNK